MLHDYLAARGVRDACEITLVMPFGRPIPPSPDASTALLAAFAERDIAFVPDRSCRALDPARSVAVLDDGSELPFDLFLGVPKHRVPARGGGERHDRGRLGARSIRRPCETRFPGVYALGDVDERGTPKAGVFAEGAARAVAAALIAEMRGGDAAGRVRGGWLLLHRVRRRPDRARRRRLPLRARADGDLTGPRPPSRDKQLFGASRRARWFGL